MIRKLRFWPLVLALGLGAMFLTGCGGGAVLSGSSWPGISASEKAIYLAFGPQVYAIDPETGDDQWRFPDEPARGQTFYAPPAVSEGIIVVADYLGSVYAINPENGDDLWSFKSDPSARFIGGPLIGDGLVYAGNANGTMYALDRQNGNEVWRYQVDRDIWSTPLLADGTLYFTSLDRNLYALDAASGALEWQYPAEDASDEENTLGAMVGTPTLVNGVLYFGAFDNRVYALDVETQQVLWSHETSSWVWSNPIFDEETGLLIAGDLDGQLFALNAEDGSPVWLVETGESVVGHPVIGEQDGGRVLYAVSGDAKLYILNIEDGSQVHEPVESTGEFPQRFLFFSTGTDFRPVAIYAPPVLFDNLVLTGLHEGTEIIRAYDRNSLELLWAFDPSAQD